MRLYETLKHILSEKRRSFHMPGHKGGCGLYSETDSVMAFDITEIPGADNLHDPHACILETELAIAEFYGAGQSKILINGSTVGILSMILGTTQPGDRILVNRNAHKSVYNAIEINQLNPVYIYPEIDDYLGIPNLLSVEDLPSDEDLREIKVCVLTYPTYEGLCYDISSIIDKCHQMGIIVLVDEAHGAHLVLDDNGPKSALQLGADVVVQSFHKTLPAMTQTAGLHFSKETLISDEQKSRIEWYLGSLQSSSPSYVLMASVDQMLDFIEYDGKARFLKIKNELTNFHKDIKELKSLKLHTFETMDMTKLILEIVPEYYKPDVWDGYKLSETLRNTFHIQCEYDSKTFVLLMYSICNDDEDLVQLGYALKTIDGEAQKFFDFNTSTVPYKSIYRLLSNNAHIEMNAFESKDYATEFVAVELSKGRIASEYVIPYPPGIPILVPGERIVSDLNILFPSDLHKIKVLIEPLTSKKPT